MDSLWCFDFGLALTERKWNLERWTAVFPFNDLFLNPPLSPGWHFVNSFSLNLKETFVKSLPFFERCANKGWLTQGKTGIQMLRLNLWSFSIESCHHICYLIVYINILDVDFPGSVVKWIYVQPLDPACVNPRRLREHLVATAIKINSRA